MRVLLLCALLVAFVLPASAVDANTVEIVYSDNTATVTVASNISDYVMVVSGTSSHVIIIQSADFAGIDATDKNEDGEIIYALSGTSDDGEFYLNGAFKCTVELNGLTLTNPRGPAINIQNGKRIEVSVKRNTTNTLTDGANDTYNGCYHCKGHTQLKGNGTLNIVGNAKHALYSKEYLEIKNLTLNITAAQKDGLHCREYMLIESGTINISGVADDAIQVELDGTTSTGTTSGHTDEDSGNFYMTGGRLTIGDYGGFAIKADGSIVLTGGNRNFDASACLANATGIDDAQTNAPKAHLDACDLLGRPLSTLPARNGHILIVDGKKIFK